MITPRMVKIEGVKTPANVPNFFFSDISNSTEAFLSVGQDSQSFLISGMLKEASLTIIKGTVIIDNQEIELNFDQDKKSTN